MLGSESRFRKALPSPSTVEQSTLTQAMTESTAQAVTTLQARLEDQEGEARAVKMVSRIVETVIYTSTAATP